MERCIKYMDRASDVFKVLSVIVFFMGLFRIVAILGPAIGMNILILNSTLGPGPMGSGVRPSDLAPNGLIGLPLILLAVGELVSTLFAVFSLYTIGVVLEFFAHLGEDVHLLRRSDWERRQVAAGKTQRMD